MTYHLYCYKCGSGKPCKMSIIVQKPQILIHSSGVYPLNGLYAVIFGILYSFLKCSQFLWISFPGYFWMFRTKVLTVSGQSYTGFNFIFYSTHLLIEWLYIFHPENELENDGWSWMTDNIGINLNFNIASVIKHSKDGTEFSFEHLCFKTAVAKWQ